MREQMVQVNLEIVLPISYETVRSRSTLSSPVVVILICTRTPRSVFSTVSVSSSTISGSKIFTVSLPSFIPHAPNAGVSALSRVKKGSQCTAR